MHSIITFNFTFSQLSLYHSQQPLSWPGLKEAFYVLKCKAEVLTYMNMQTWKKNGEVSQKLKDHSISREDIQ